MTSKSFFAAFTLLCLAAVPNLHAAQCSNESVSGIYAYSSQGFVEVSRKISPAGFAPWAQIGLTEFDGKGNIPHGTFTFNTTTPGGGPGRGTFAGTYNVNPDCTGTAELVLEAGEITLLHFDLVVLSEERLTLVNTDPSWFLSIYSFQKIGPVNE